MDRTKPFTKAGFARAFVVPALLLFGIPAGGYEFARYAAHSLDARFVDNVAQSVAADSELTTERRDEINAFYRANPPSRLCAGGAAGRDALPPDYADTACGEFQQFDWICAASLGSVGLGLLSVLVLIGCVALSFVSRELQYVGFVTGWHFLRLASAVQVLAQGFIATMLSFWITAFFFERYSIKLVGVVGILALVGAVMVIAAIFKKPDDKMTVEGELLTRETSPELWAHVEGLCQRVGTQPPDQIIGGIDDNFFVTEHPVHLAESITRGRTLFVSLSLLKRLDRSEADAILTHEMAHFSGGDTLYSKKLAPVLSRFVTYMSAIHAHILSRPIFYFMLCYWSMFQLSLSRTSRERELRADRIAADTTSPEAVASALYKVTAYSSYRARVEEGLFDRDRAHSDLNIATSVAVGFTEYANGPRLSADLEAEAFPHPYDRHPPLEVRVVAVGVQVPANDIANIVVTAPARTWFQEIGEAERIETALWDAYQARFRAAHEESLAYRYLPATPEERLHVERYFPALELPSKDGEAGVSLDCEQLRCPEWDSAVAWTRISQIMSKDDTFRGKLLIFHISLETGGKEKRKLQLRKLADQATVLAVINRYYSRAMTAQAVQARAS